MKVSVSQAELAAADADLLVVGLCEGEDLPAALADAPGAAGAKGGFKKLVLVHPESPSRALVVGLGKRADLDAEKARVAAALAAKEAAKLDASSIAWALPGRGRRPGAGRGHRHRDDPRRLPLRPLQERGPRRPYAPRPRVADAARARLGRRRGRGGPRLRRGTEPRPRPAEPALATSPPRPIWPRAPSRSPPPTTTSASRCSGARRSPPRRWAAWSRSARAAQRSRS